VVYTGAVGDDDLAEQLKAANERDGLDEVYEVVTGEKTGACAVILTAGGHYQYVNQRLFCTFCSSIHCSSLVTTLRVAEKFTKSHLSSPKVAPLIESAKYFYIEGYFLTHGVESALELSSKVALAGKVCHITTFRSQLPIYTAQTFALNMSAPFIPQFFKAQLDQVLLHTDILLGTESDAEAYANAAGYPDPKDIPDIARRIALLDKSNKSRPRVVIFTQAAASTIVVSSNEPDQPKTFAVEKLTDDQIVDKNGAGDAFAGGVLAALVAGKDLGKAVLVGHALARASISQVSLLSHHYLKPVLTRTCHRSDHNILGQRSTSSSWVLVFSTRV
jgi:adenosine kinase